MQKIIQWITIISFFGIVLFFSVMTLFGPKTKFSELENRSLEQLPQLNITSWFNDDKDMRFQTKFNNFMNDQFIGRDNWVKITADIELMMGKKEFDGVYIVGDTMYKDMVDISQKNMEKSIAAINKFASQVKKPFYMMLAPTSSGIYYDKLPSHATVVNQKGFIEDVYSKIDANVTKIDLYEPLFSQRNDYIYYRTDHHWTSLGAYYAYAAAALKMGYTPILASAYDIEHASYDFLGTTYSQVPYSGAKKDIIDFYTYSKGYKITSFEYKNSPDENVYDSMYFREWLEKKDKYAAFTGQNAGEVVIKTDCPSNKKLLLIKDSYANSYLQFLTQHYSEIVMVDLRFITNYLTEYMDVNEFDQILMLYNTESFSNDTSIIKLAK